MNLVMKIGFGVALSRGLLEVRPEPGMAFRLSSGLFSAADRLEQSLGIGSRQVQRRDTS